MTRAAIAEAPRAAEPSPQTPRRRVAARIVDELVECGIDTYFGIPGGPIISVFHQVHLHPDARLVESRHESGAAFAALGYHRSSGRVPALLVTAGPGVTNVVTGIAAAYLERVPMLVICGDVASDGRRLLQDLDTERAGGIERLLGGVTRLVRRVERPEAATSALRAALRAATDPERPGPAVLVVPIDAADVETEASPRHFATLATPRAEAPLDPAAVEAAVAHLRRARRPLVLVGAGCRGHEVEVRRLVDALGAPFMTTPQAKGLLPESHPASLRNGGMSSSYWARRYTKEGADVALVLGSDLDDVSTAGTPVIGDGGALIHVDTDADVFGRNFPTAVAVHGRLERFCREAGRRVAADDAFPKDAETLLAEAKSGSPFDVQEFRSDEAPVVAPHRVIADLESAASPDDRFVTDIGEHMLFVLHYLTCDDPSRLAIHLGLGSMGSGIGAAVGLALGDPSRRVICVCGDGGMQMTGAEILVARAHRLPIVYAVFNDARYNMVYHGYRLTHEREEPWATGRMDFVKWADAHGVAGRRIERPGEITAELLDALTANGPAVLDIRQDPDRRIRGDGRIEALRQMSFGEEQA